MNKGPISGFSHFRDPLTRPSKDRVNCEYGCLISSPEALRKVGASFENGAHASANSRFTAGGSVSRLTSRSPGALSVCEEAFVVKR